MSEHYIKSLLPKWLKLKVKEGEFEFAEDFFSARLAPFEESLSLCRERLERLKESLVFGRNSFEFQTKWEDIFLKKWSELIDSERESINIWMI